MAVARTFGTVLLVVSALLAAVSGAPPHRVNQLVGLPSLPKPHYASNAAITAADLTNPGRWALWGEFARIAHSLPVSLMSWGADVPTMKAIVELASKHNASISGQYSPWYSSAIQAGCKAVCSTCGPLPPHVCNPEISANESQELQILQERLGNLTTLAASHDGLHPVRVSLVFLDSERFVYNGTSSSTWRAALTRKHNLIYSMIKSLAPDATVVQYGRGEVERVVPDQIPIPSFHPRPFYPISADGWPTPFYSGYYTGQEKGDCFSMHLYQLNQLAHTRQNFNATVQNAVANDVHCVIPTLCLGCGLVQHFEGHSFSFNHNYSLHYSWVWGAELNDPAYGADPQRFAAWDYATAVTLFPGPFGYFGPARGGGREQPTGAPEDGNNTGLDHFIAYVWGAAGVQRLQ